MATLEAPRVRGILAVEDEPDHLMAVEMLFRWEPGYAFFGAGTTADAEKILGKEKIDLILLDLMMPVLDGADVLLQKKKDPTIDDIPVIALTALDSPFDQIMWQARTDLQDFIVKSRLPRRELIARIERVLELHPRSPDRGQH